MPQDAESTSVGGHAQPLRTLSPGSKARLAQHGTWFYDAEHDATFWSPAMYRVFGRPVASGPLPHDQWHHVLHPSDREHYDDALAGALHEGRPYRLLLQLTRPDGGRTTVQARCEPTEPPHGERHSLHGTVQDPPEETLERALEMSRERLTDIVENIREGFFTLQPDFTVTYFNRAAEQLVGRPRAEILGRPLFDVFPEGRGSFLEEQYRRALAERCQLAFETYFEPHAAWYDVSVHPYDEGIAVCFRVNNDRKELEARLQQAERMEAVGQLAGGVAHDFNNILTAILGNVELLRLGLSDVPGVDDLTHEAVDQIEKASQRAASLTRQLLAFSRRQFTRPEQLDLRTVVREMEKMLRRLLPEDIRLVTDLDVPVAPIHADHSQLQQVILNLLVNARDAMPSGGTLTITVRPEDVHPLRAAHVADARAGPHVCLAVQDTGVGMDEQVRSRIFEPFFTTKPSGVGTGLGLATVHGVVRQAGGFVQVSSQLGAGTTLKVYIPADPEADRPAAAAESLVTAPGGHETILVCEDDDAVRQLTRRTLAAHGYQVLAARNAEAALSIASDHEGAIALLLTDVIMPGTNGRELADRLRRERSDLRVLFMSGYSTSVIGRHGVLDGGIEFLEKPFSTHQLLRRIREILEQ
jgi:two-component system cell cycle sensor histidine kinase/response regulator CckA